MDCYGKKYITELKFVPKDGTNGVYHKVYANHDNYAISIDFNTEHIGYGDKIIAEDKTTQNSSIFRFFISTDNTRLLYRARF